MYFRLSKFSLSLWFSCQTLHASFLSALRATCTTHPILCDLITQKIWWGIQIINFLIMQSTLVSCYIYFVPSRPRYLPQHPTRKRPQVMFLPQRQTPNSHPCETSDNILFLYTLNFIFLMINWETIDSVGNCSTHSFLIFFC